MLQKDSYRCLIGLLSGIALSLCIAYFVSVLGSYQGTGWEIPSISSLKAEIDSLVAANLHAEARFLRMANFLVANASAMVAFPIVLAVGMVKLMPHASANSTDRIVLLGLRNYLCLAGVIFASAFFLSFIQPRVQQLTSDDLLMSSTMTALDWSLGSSLLSLLPSIGLIAAVIEQIATQKAHIRARDQITPAQ